MVKKAVKKEIIIRFVKILVFVKLLLCSLVWGEEGGDLPQSAGLHFLQGCTFNSYKLNKYEDKIIGRLEENS